MADLILVLQDGTITESGTHEKLLETNGLYASLHILQASAYEPDSDS
ncbi:MAG TPA: hypothetical protein VGR06_22785 [Actinophytocola sp.]|jgi:ATP-binding cassette subfamily B protein|nr:hypothetical protein [Actinophytocola sp.]